LRHRQLLLRQKYCYHIAKSIGGDKQFIFTDEFCSNLDGVTAEIISANIRKFATKSDKIFILASSRDDLLADLLPEVIVVLYSSYYFLMFLL